MSSTTTAVSTGTNGDAISGTSGTTIASTQATEVSGSEFLTLMMQELEHQDPTNPDSSDPSQFLDELAQMTSVEQETNTAQSTSTSATEQQVSTAIGLIGSTVSYTDATSGDTETGTVGSVQITSSGATLTVSGVAGISTSALTSVSPASSSSSSTSTGTSAT